jgi:mono/diheme cytochrome c family protein
LVTEIPEHLLRRSKERRAALSGEGAPEATAEAAATVAAASPPVPASSASATPATEASRGGSGGAVTGARAATEPAPRPRIGPTRAGIPIWIMPVLVALPLWGIIYLGAFGNRAKANANDPVTLGGHTYLTSCSSCHGASGEGGVGPQLNGGEVIKVWPKVSDHIKWVQTGGAPYVGGTIGATHIPVPPSNVMPSFQNTLSPDQIAQVVCYERVAFGGEKESTANCPGFAG